MTLDWYFKLLGVPVILFWSDLSLKKTSTSNYYNWDGSWDNTVKIMEDLPSGVVQCGITSPPYW
jgi:hypothetical protein